MLGVPAKACSMYNSVLIVSMEIDPASIIFPSKNNNVQRVFSILYCNNVEMLIISSSAPGRPDDP
jgi:hypothetical protein